MTGAAGFIGSHVTERLLADPGVDVIAVDDYRTGQLGNIAHLRITDAVMASRFLRNMERGSGARPDAIVHLGAITDTTCHDHHLLARRNVGYSLRLAQVAADHEIAFVYASSASVYGTSSRCVEDPRYEAPCNPYAASKLLVDGVLRPRMARPRPPATLVGLRLFNVYGSREGHKGPMASIIHQAVAAIQRDEPVRLFDGCPDAPDGTITRDWVLVDDVAEVVVDLLNGAPRTGVVNVGSGTATTFEHVAELVIATMGRGRVETIAFPAHLRGHYQYRTVADLTALRRLGIDRPFTPVDQGVPAVVSALIGRPVTASPPGP